jgi:hypothetical protein
MPSTVSHPDMAAPHTITPMETPVRTAPNSTVLRCTETLPMAHMAVRPIPDRVMETRLTRRTVDTETHRIPPMEVTELVAIRPIRPTEVRHPCMVAATPTIQVTPVRTRSLDRWDTVMDPVSGRILVEN